MGDTCIVCAASLLGEDRFDGVCTDCREDGSASLAGIEPRPE